MTEERNPAEGMAMGTGTAQISSDSKEGDFRPEELQSSISAHLPVEAVGVSSTQISSDSEEGDVHPEEPKCSTSALLPAEGTAEGTGTTQIDLDLEDGGLNAVSGSALFFAEGKTKRHLQQDLDEEETETPLHKPPERPKEAEKPLAETKLTSAALYSDVKMNLYRHLQRNNPSRQNQPPWPLMKDVEAERLMDSRMYMKATQGHVDDFIEILQLIASEEDLQDPQIQIQYKISPQYNTCLHIAAGFGHLELAKYIVGKYPDVIKEKNCRGDTALHIAARRKDLSFVKSVMESCPSGSTASRDVEKAEHSLLRTVNDEKNTVLHEAVINHCKEEEVVEVLIKNDPQVAYYPNMQGKSPLYLAAAAHFFHVVEGVQKCKLVRPVENSGCEAKPAVYGAIWGKNKEMLEKILEMEPVHPSNEHGITPLHYAAWIGFHEGIQQLLDRYSLDGYERDSRGFCPIHVASQQGHLDFVRELLNFSPDSKELLSEREGGNFLHVAAMFGKENIVKFVLKEKGLQKLINEEDRCGDTPLHWATKGGHAEVVCSLTWDRRVGVNLVNNRGLTAFEIATSIRYPSFRQRLIWVALRSAGAKPPPEWMDRPQNFYESSGPPNMMDFKDRVNTLMLVSTLVATVTFAAGFTVPGGNNDDSGAATLLARQMFHVFVICNTIALYTSITAVITLIWAQLNDLNLIGTAMSMALPLLGTAVTAVCLAFMAGVYLVVSNLYWLAITILIIGSVSIVSLLIPFLLLFLPNYSTNCIIRCISYYPFRILIWASTPRIKRDD